MFIRECMTKNPVTAVLGDTLASADAKMKAGGFRRLPVVHEGKLIGHPKRVRHAPLPRIARYHCGA